MIAHLRQKIAGPATFSIQGRVEGETVNISTKLPSRVADIYVKEGQAVRAGEPLVQLISPEIDAKKKQAAAMLQSALAFQSSTDRGTRQENVDTLYASGKVPKLRQHWQRRAIAVVILYQEGVISRQRRDEMRAAKQSSAQIRPSSTAAVSKSRAWSH